VSGARRCQEPVGVRSLFRRSPSVSDLFSGEPVGVRARRCQVSFPRPACATRPARDAMRGHPPGDQRTRGAGTLQPAHRTGHFGGTAGREPPRRARAGCGDRPAGPPVPVASPAGPVGIRARELRPQRGTGPEPSARRANRAELRRGGSPCGSPGPHGPDRKAPGPRPVYRRLADSPATPPRWMG
jgi:hypothetical protein